MRFFLVPLFSTCKAWARAAVSLFYERVNLCCDLQARKLAELLSRTKQSFQYSSFLKHLSVRLRIDDSIKSCRNEKLRCTEFAKTVKDQWHALADLMELCPNARSIGMNTVRAKNNNLATNNTFPDPDALLRIVRCTRGNLQSFAIRFTGDMEADVPPDGPNFQALEKCPQEWWRKFQAAVPMLRELALCLPSEGKVPISDLYVNFIKAAPSTLQHLDCDRMSLKIFRKLAKVVPYALQSFICDNADIKSFNDIGSRCKTLKHLNFDAADLLKQPPYGPNDLEGKTCPFHSLERLTIRNAYPELAFWFVAANHPTLLDVRILLKRAKGAKRMDVPVDQQNCDDPPNPHIAGSIRGYIKERCSKLRTVEVRQPPGVVVSPKRPRVHVNPLYEPLGRSSMPRMRGMASGIYPMGGKDSDDDSEQLAGDFEDDDHQVSDDSGDELDISDALRVGLTFAALTGRQIDVRGRRNGHEFVLRLGGRPDGRTGGRWADRDSRGGVQGRQNVTLPPSGLTELD
ncbi:hypothetical protein HK097_007098 [Rhizophlyctis rosea]|uniref:Uncharacterized protein n=1 Tax=Rhizophlyctis rosea TaxID=64517 RepID=A0AAD5SC26_9FUNG|nr:hypothetical protein HK097_007098 [Rhizophlyctis rosea]